MKNIKKYIIITVAFLSCCTGILQAQSQNEFTVSLGAGSSALKYKINNENSKSGFGWQFGAGYSHYFSKSIGISLGLEAAMFGSSLNMKNISFEQQIQTPPGLYGSFLLKTNYDGLEEKQTAIMFQVPVMLQFQFPVSEKSFFFLGTGVKIGFPVSSKWNQDISTVSTSGYSDYTNQQYIDMPNHGFSTYSGLNPSGILELKSAVSLALEGGLKFNIGERKYLYTGLFLDYGLNDIYKAPATSTSMLTYNDASPADHTFNSAMTSNLLSGGIKPFAIGVKIRIGIGMGNEKTSKPKTVKEKVVPKQQKPEPVWGW